MIKVAGDFALLKPIEPTSDGLMETRPDIDNEWIIQHWLNMPVGYIKEWSRVIFVPHSAHKYTDPEWKQRLFVESKDILWFITNQD